MFINLHEIPHEGKNWILNRQTAELNLGLKDLLGKTPYNIEFTIRPLDGSSGTYDLTGTMKTELPEQCSRCGLDYDMAVDERFHYLMVPELETPRDAKFSKANHFSDLHEENLEVAEYQGTSFNVGEFFHELVALSEPLIPSPAPNEKGDCRVCQIPLKGRSFNYDEEIGESAKNKPFEALKGIKLNN
jgi:uncharacterized protein